MWKSKSISLNFTNGVSSTLSTRKKLVVVTQNHIHFQKYHCWLIPMYFRSNGFHGFLWVFFVCGVVRFFFDGAIYPYFWSWTSHLLTEFSTIFSHLLSCVCQWIEIIMLTSNFIACGKFTDWDCSVRFLIIRWSLIWIVFYNVFNNTIVNR